MLRKHPLAPISAAYKRAVVRSCAEQLREIEGRLDNSCGARWEQQLQGCDDLGTVARLILALQRRSSLQLPESGWLDELSGLKPEEVDRRAVELTLRIKHRLAELSESVPYAVDPSTLIGAPVLRNYDGVGAFPGVVMEFERLVGFRVRYSDGEFEDVPLRELQSMLLRQGIQAAAPSAEAGEAAGGGGVLLAPGYEAYGDDATVGFVYDRMLERQQAGAGAEEGLAREGDRYAPSLASALAPRPPSAPPSQKRGPGRPPKSSSAASASAQQPAAKAGGAAPGGHGAEVGGRSADASGSGGAAGSSSSGAAKRKVSEEAELPPGWTVEGEGSKKVFSAPDGMTRVTSIAQVRRWQRSQMNLVAQYERVSEKKRQKEAPPPPKPDYGDMGVRSCAPTDAWLAVPRTPAPLPRPAARSQLPTSGMSLEDAAAAAAAMAGRADGKGVPRELRMLAMPDRDWKVAIAPFAIGSKTRVQFSAQASSDETAPPCL